MEPSTGWICLFSPGSGRWRCWGGAHAGVSLCLCLHQLSVDILEPEWSGVPYSLKLGLKCGVWSTSALSWGIPCSGTCCGSCQLVSPSSLCLPFSFLPLAHHFCHVHLRVSFFSHCTWLLTRQCLSFPVLGPQTQLMWLKPVSYSQSIHAFMSSRLKSVVFIKPWCKYACADQKISMKMLVFVMDDTSIPCTRLLWGFFSMWGLIAHLMGMCLCIRENKCFLKTCWNVLKWRTSLKLSSLPAVLVIWEGPTWREGEGLQLYENVKPQVYSYCFIVLDYFNFIFLMSFIIEAKWTRTWIECPAQLPFRWTAL